MRGVELTERQHEVLSTIREHVQKWGIPPSRADLARSLGFAFPAAVNHHLQALQRKGWIRINRGMDRGIQLLREGTPLFDPDELPAVAAGTPSLADETKAVTRVPKAVSNLIHPRADFYLVVRGDSMDLIGYQPGDIVAVHRNPNPRDGDIVIARIGTEITMKCFKQPNKTTIELQPQSSNPEHQPMLITGETEDWEIVGVVVGAMIGKAATERGRGAARPEPRGPTNL